MIAEKLKSEIRDVPDFPKEGIMFKDITPVLQNAELRSEIVEALYQNHKNDGLDAIVGIESRGFLFGVPLADKLGIPFVPIRKVGKLPYKTIKESYDLEYGKAEVEIHEDGLKPNWNVLVHDDLLATGGTAVAASKLVNALGANASGYSFLINLDFLNGSENLKPYSENIISLVTY